jgi:hypothetical protein
VGLASLGTWRLRRGEGDVPWSGPPECAPFRRSGPGRGAPLRTRAEHALGVVQIAVDGSKAIVGHIAARVDRR